MSLEIIIRGAHDTGRSTAANLIKMFLDENGYTDVKVLDMPPLPAEQKARFWDRFTRNRAQPVRIRVELVVGSGVYPQKGADLADETMREETIRFEINPERAFEMRVPARRADDIFAWVMLSRERAQQLYRLLGDKLADQHTPWTLP